MTGAIAAGCPFVIKVSITWKGYLAELLTIRLLSSPLSIPKLALSSSSHRSQHQEPGIVPGRDDQTNTFGLFLDSRIVELETQRSVSHARLVRPEETEFGEVSSTLPRIIINMPFTIFLARSGTRCARLNSGRLPKCCLESGSRAASGSASCTRRAGIVAQD
jgi:hypothetical protein